MDVKTAVIISLWDNKICVG